MAKKLPKEIDINNALDFVRAALESESVEITDAAESVLSWCVYNLRHYKAEMPKEMIPFYLKIVEYVTNGDNSSTSDDKLSR